MKTGTILLPMLLLTVLTLLFSGCGGDGMTTVSGTLCWQGVPIQKGRIQFIPIDGKSAQTEAVVTDGKYSVKVPPGEKRIQIYAFEEGPERNVMDRGKVAGTIRDLKQILPPEMNEKSQIQVTIRGGKQRYDYEK